MISACDSCWYLVCLFFVDYNTTDDYRSHTSCITEKERYEGKKPKVKASPQDAWMVLLAESVEKAPGRLQPHLSAMVSLANVPRKAQAFRNFTANSLNLRGKQGDAVVTDLWDFLQKVRNEHKETNTETKCVGSNQKGTSQQPAPSERASSETMKAAVPESSQSTNDDKAKAKQNSAATKPEVVDKKTVRKAMKRMLKKHKSLTVKVLRKEVRVKLGNVSKSQVKDLVRAELGDKDLFTVEGKTIRLRASG
jgi:LYAR-type C2HC zinc finger